MGEGEEEDAIILVDSDTMIALQRKNLTFDCIVQIDYGNNLP